ncbi:MAG: hypothetical protein Q4D12_08950 [Bacteroidales bacterium]|nr:hypothetical protein [Bacteroidales bacterium]
MLFPLHDGHAQEDHEGQVDEHERDVLAFQEITGYQQQVVHVEQEEEGQWPAGVVEYVAPVYTFAAPFQEQERGGKKEGPYSGMDTSFG